MHGIGAGPYRGLDIIVHNTLGMQKSECLSNVQGNAPTPAASITDRSDSKAPDQIHADADLIRLHAADSVPLAPSHVRSSDVLPQCAAFHQLYHHHQLQVTARIAAARVRRAAIHPQHLDDIGVATPLQDCNLLPKLALEDNIADRVQHFDGYWLCAEKRPRKNLRIDKDGRFEKSPSCCRGRP